MENKIMINALDLFAGAGGMSKGFEDAGYNVVAAIEYNKDIAETYKYNHPNTTIIVDDIRTIPSEKISNLFKEKNMSCDVVFGGPPCQGFSMAGRRIRSKGSFLNDPRNFLFLEYVRMVKELNPLVFVLENVPGILNYNNGEIKEEIIEAFTSLGYSVSSKVLCAADYGVPQTRKRAVFIGNRLGVDSEKFFPSPTNSEKNYCTIRDAISDLPPLNSGEGDEVTFYPAKEQLTEYQKKMHSSKGCTYNHISSVHAPETIKIMKMVQPGQTMKDLPQKYQTKSVHSGAYGRMEYDEPAYTLTTRLNTPSVGRITHPTQNRTITPREAARIQSFPDDYRFLGDVTSIGIQIGNAVPPLLAEKIAEKVKAILCESKKI